jgi:hypothetical protein
VALRAAVTAEEPIEQSHGDSLSCSGAAGASVPMTNRP